jgi:hypothetical protein
LINSPNLSIFSPSRLHFFPYFLPPFPVKFAPFSILPPSLLHLLLFPATLPVDLCALCSPRCPAAHRGSSPSLVNTKNWGLAIRN